MTILFRFVRRFRFDLGNVFARLVGGINVLDTMSRTGFQAFAAIYTFAVIDNRHVVYKVNSAVGAGTLALAACDTARLALGHNVLTAAFRRTGNVYLSRLGHALDKAFGTGLDTQSAGTANIGVDMRVAVEAFNSHIRTCVHAASAAHTADFASFSSASKHILIYAVAVALIGVLVVALVAAAASHHRNRRLRRAVEGNTENIGNFYLRFLVSLPAGVERSLAFHKSLGKARAAGVSASAAVCARKTLLHFLDTGIFLDLTEARNKYDTQSQYQSYAGHYAHYDSERSPVYISADTVGK